MKTRHPAITRWVMTALPVAFLAFAASATARPAALWSGGGQTRELSPPPAAPLTVRLTATRSAIGMGETVRVYARVTAGGRPAAGVLVQPYVGGKQWGASARTNARGRAELLLPLPNPGVVAITAVAGPEPRPAAVRWIWGPEVRDGQTLFFTRSFIAPAGLRAASLFITCDDAYRVWLNGSLIGQGSDFHRVARIGGLELRIRPGLNRIAVEARNGTGPAGLLARLEMETRSGHPPGRQVIATDRSWRYFSAAPAGWPAMPGTPWVGNGAAAREEAAAGEGVWGRSLVGWPGLAALDRFPVGRPLPLGAAPAPPLRIRVRRKTIRRPIATSAHMVGIEWEPWFTPHNAGWETAEAIPILGRYDSFNRDVIRQHALWLAGAGVDFLLADWSNNLWGKQHWSEREPGVNELIRATEALLDTYAAMRAEGIPVPKVVLLLGLDNGPATTTTALNEEMRWIAERYLDNNGYRGLWLEYEGKPLILLFNGGGPAIRARQPAIDASRFTVRWMASQLQINHLDRQGYWSWMDGTIHPVPTFQKRACEALTITPAFFAAGGWTAPTARGRRHGATFKEEFDTALRWRPRFLLICQWNEFAGQPQGHGYGPRHDQYVDCYSAELSNDIEPTSRSAPGYRSPGGWGFAAYYQMRSLIQLYRRKCAGGGPLAPATHRSPSPNSTSRIGFPLR